jgi:hypothetical protein
MYYVLYVRYTTKMMPSSEPTTHRSLAFSYVITLVFEAEDNAATSRTHSTTAIVFRLLTADRPIASRYTYYVVGKDLH